MVINHFYIKDFGGQKVLRYSENSTSGISFLHEKFHIVAQTSGNNFHWVSVGLLSDFNAMKDEVEMIVEHFSKKEEVI